MKFGLEWLTDRWVFILFLVVGVGTFGLAIFNSFVGDDLSLIVNNRVAHSIFNVGSFFSGGAFDSGGAAKLAGFYYKPILLVVLSSWYMIVGPNPGAFHLLQILIHVLNAFLVFILFKKFFLRGLAVGLGLLFLVHPANVEAVIYTSGIQEPIFLFFGLIALLGRIYFPINGRTNVLVTAGLLLALLSKETGILFAVILCIHNFLFDKGRGWQQNAIIVAAVVGVYSFLRFLVAGVYFSSQPVAPIIALGLIDRLMNLPKILLVNLQTIFFPKELAFAQNWIVKTPDLPNFFLPVIVCLGFIGLLVWLFIKLRKDHKVAGVFLFFGTWAAMGITIHLQLIPLDGTFSERWLYLPLIGFLGLTGVVIERWFSSPKFLKIVVASFLILVTTFLVRDITRIQEWKTQFSLYLADADKNGGSFILYNGLAQEYIDKKDFSKAEMYAVKSVAIFPTFLNWNNLGVVYSKTGRYDEAIKALNESLKFGPYYLAYENIIGTNLLKGDLEEAVKISETAMNYFPRNSKLLVFWSVAKYKLGDRQAALNGSQRAIQIEQTPETLYLWQAVNNGTEIILGN